MPHSDRKTLKGIVKFAIREFREKKPLSVRVLRVKDKRVYSIGGPVPVITIKKTQIPYYIIALEYGEDYRIYNFTKMGVMINGENIEKDSKKMNQIEKSTKLHYKLDSLKFRTFRF